MKKEIKFKFKCQVCGKCCEMLRPDCEHYDKETKKCKVHGPNKPEECKNYPNPSKYCCGKERDRFYNDFTHPMNIRYE